MFRSGRFTPKKAVEHRLNGLRVFECIGNQQIGGP